MLGEGSTTEREICSLHSETGSHWVIQAGCELAILLPQPPIWLRLQAYPTRSKSAFPHGVHSGLKAQLGPSWSLRVEFSFLSSEVLGSLVSVPPQDKRSSEKGTQLLLSLEQWFPTCGSTASRGSGGVEQLFHRGGLRPPEDTYLHYNS